MRVRVGYVVKSNTSDLLAGLRATGHGEQFISAGVMAQN
jgi:hypothetical protein